MRVLIIYDSEYGNTSKIAHAIGDGLSTKAEVTISSIKDLKDDDMLEIDMVIIGSPTQGFKPTKPITDFLHKIPAGDLKGIKVAVFDTRLAIEAIQSPFLKLIVKIGGFAAKHIAKKLKEKGGELIVLPEGFLVNDKEGPLKEGELERAKNWLVNWI